MQQELQLTQKKLYKSNENIRNFEYKQQYKENALSSLSKSIEDLLKENEQLMKQVIAKKDLCPVFVYCFYFDVLKKQ